MGGSFEMNEMHEITFISLNFLGEKKKRDENYNENYNLQFSNTTSMLPIWIFSLPPDITAACSAIRHNASCQCPMVSAQHISIWSPASSSRLNWNSLSMTKTFLELGNLVWTAPFIAWNLWLFGFGRYPNQSLQRMIRTSFCIRVCSFSLVVGNRKWLPH